MSRPSKISNAASDRGTKVEDRTGPLTPPGPLPAYGSVVGDDSLTASLSLGVPKERSGLAFAAGFAALAYLLQFPLVPIIFDLIRSGSGIVAAALALTANLLAVIALWLGMIGWADLKRHPDKSGRLPATLGVIVGFWGTLNLILGVYQVAKFLRGYE